VSSDFEKFQDECKGWPSSEIVEDLMDGRMWPTILIGVSGRRLPYFAELRHGHGRSTHSQISKEILAHLAEQEATAFALILPIEADVLVELGPAIAALTGELPEWAELYTEAALVHAFALDGTQRALLGLANYAPEVSIDRWVGLPCVPGVIAEAAEQAASAWRELQKAAASG
jgi:hypothetical protein